MIIYMIMYKQRLLMPIIEPLAIPIRAKPICEIDEYANNLFILDCPIAEKAPNSIDKIDTIISMDLQSSINRGNPVTRNLVIKPRAAIFGATAKNAVIVVGAPS